MLTNYTKKTKTKAAHQWSTICSIKHVLLLWWYEQTGDSNLACSVRSRLWYVELLANYIFRIWKKNSFFILKSLLDQWKIVYKLSNALVRCNENQLHFIHMWLRQLMLNSFLLSIVSCNFSSFLISTHLPQRPETLVRSLGKKCQTLFEMVQAAEQYAMDGLQLLKEPFQILVPSLLRHIVLQKSKSCYKRSWLELCWVMIPTLRTKFQNRHNNSPATH